jgi:hypothetical protein
MTDDELVRVRAEARGRATQPDDPSIPTSLTVHFAYGYAAACGWVDCDVDRQRPWITQYGELKRAPGELWESFSQKIRDSEPIGTAAPLTVHSSVSVNFDLVEKVRVMGMVWERLPDEAWSTFERRFTGGESTPRGRRSSPEALSTENWRHSKITPAKMRILFSPGWPRDSGKT